MVGFPLVLIAVMLPVPQADAALRGRDRHARLAILARRAVCQSARLSALPLAELKQTAEGAPLDWRGTYWSLSHKTARVAGIAAPVPVGIDLEVLRPVVVGMYAKVAADAEWDLLGGDRRPENFFRLWTAKEAVLKAVGEGLRGLGGCRLVQASADDLRLTHRESSWTVRQHRRGDHLAAVAAGIDFRVRWLFAADKVSVV